MSVVRMQHYVPQSYLRKFADKREQFFAFDKQELRSFPVRVRNVAVERDFYDLSPRVVKETGLDPKILEGGYGRLVDSTLMGEVHKLLKLDQDDPASHDLRVHIAQFILFQYARTRTALNTAIETQQSFFQGLCQQLIMLNEGKEYLKYTPKVTMDEKDVATILALNSFDTEMTVPIVTNIVNRHWVLGKVVRGKLLYASDSPVVVQPIGNEHDGIGLISPNTRIMLPLTPQLALIVTEFGLDRRHVRTYKDCCRELICVKSDIHRLNRQQVVQSGRWIFSREDDFEIARKICEQEPEFRDPNPKRVSVRHGKPVRQEDGTITTTIEAILGTPDCPPPNQTIPDDFTDF